METANFADRLIAAIDAKGSRVVVGLDPRFGEIPDFVRQEARSKYGATMRAVADAIVRFNRAIVDAVAPHAVAVKPQIAFYECFGHWGIRAFEETIRYARRRGLIVIADAKRNDIGSTAQAYADAYLGEVELWEGRTRAVFDADAVTVNPYLGYDGIEPFKKSAVRYGKGLFALVRTSNPSAKELQDLTSGGMSLYQIVGQLVNAWGEGTEGTSGYKSIGAVVGATYPDEARHLRRLMPKCFFLVPGYGAQGGTAQDVAACFNRDGYGALVNSSRDIIFAYKHQRWRSSFSVAGFDRAAEAAVMEMKGQVERVLRERR